MPDTAAALVIQLSADLKQFRNEMRNATGVFDAEGRKIEKRQAALRKNIEQNFGAIGTAIAGAFTLRSIQTFVGGIAESADRLQSLSERLGIGTTDLQGLAAAGRQANVDTDSLNSSLDTFAKNLGEASTGQGKLAQVMRQDGIATGKDMLTTLLNVADAVKNAKTRQEEYRIVTAAFGESNADLVNFLRQGAAAIRDQANAFKGIDEGTVQSLAQINTDFKEISVSLQNMAAGPVAGMLNGLTQFLRDLEGGTWSEKLQALAAFFSFGTLSSSPLIGNDQQKYQVERGNLSKLLAQRQQYQDLVDKAGGTGRIGAQVPTQGMLDNLDNQIAAKRQQIDEIETRLRTAAAAPNSKPLGTGVVPPAASKSTDKSQADAELTIQQAKDRASAANAKRLDDDNDRLHDAVAKQIDTYADGLRQQAADAKATDDEIQALKDESAKRDSERLQDQIDAQHEAWQRVGSDALHNLESVALGYESIGDAAKAVLLDVAELIAKTYILKALGIGNKSDTSGGSSGDSIIGDIASGVLKAFAGGFADGGTINAGPWGVVGERGPELISAGRQPVTITPMASNTGRSGPIEIAITLDNRVFNAK
jgi:hypothetical protein